MFSHPIAAVFSFLCCFLLQYSQAEADVANQPPPGAGKTVAASELRQSVALDGAYASEFLIEGDWSASSGGQEVTLIFSGRDLDNVRQIELILEPTPASAFDLESAVFTSLDPIVTLGRGLEVIEGDRLHLGGASISDPVEGDQRFGTFTVSTSDMFTSRTSAQLEVSFLSLGPNSNDREAYNQEVLGLGVVVSVGETETVGEMSTWGRIKALLAR